MKGALANLNYTKKIKPVRPEMKGLAFCLLFVFLLACLLVSPAAGAVEWKITPSNPAVGDTLKIKGTASPGESIRAEISFEQGVPVSGGRYQYLVENVKVPAGDDNRFTVRANGVKNLHVGVKKVVWINLQSEASCGVATISQGHVPPLTYGKILIDGDAEDRRPCVNIRFTASQTLTADSKGKFEYSYDTSSMPAGKFNVKIGGSEETIILRSKCPEKPVVEKPVAEFSASPTSGSSPLEVSFTDQSEGEPTAWRWIFGDGTCSTEKNPVHTYDRAGKYTISLKVWNEAGQDEVIKFGYITVSEPANPPVAKFSASLTSGHAPLEVSFTDLSTGEPTSWTWSFGDGTYSTEQNPVHKYDKPGEYTVSLMVSNAAGQDRIKEFRYITVSAPLKPPVARFSSSPVSGHAPLEVSFTDQSRGNPTSWRWSFGDGTHSTEENPVHTYEKAGKYTVTLKVWNDAGRDEIKKYSYITVSKPRPPVAKFFASPTSGHAPLKVSFTDHSRGNPTSWTWSFGDGTYSTEQNPVHKYDKPGEYTVSLKVKNAGGTVMETRFEYIAVSRRR